MPRSSADDDDDDDEGGGVELVSDQPRKRYRTSRRDRGVPRARTVAVRRITQAELAAGAILNPPIDIPRPQTRGECRGDARPCPWVACRHHLYLEVNAESGSIKFNFPSLEPWELQHTCSLDVADRGGITLEEVGEITNLTRERVRQIEVRGLVTLKRDRRAELGDLDPTTEAA